jgi:hypothetical protein
VRRERQQAPAAASCARRGWAGPSPGRVRTGHRGGRTWPWSWPRRRRKPLPVPRPACAAPCTRATRACPARRASSARWKPAPRRAGPPDRGREQGVDVEAGRKTCRTDEHQAWTAGSSSAASSDATRDSTPPRSRLQSSSTRRSLISDLAAPRADQLKAYSRSTRARPSAPGDLAPRRSGRTSLRADPDPARTRAPRCSRRAELQRLVLAHETRRRASSCVRGRSPVSPRAASGSRRAL